MGGRCLADTGGLGLFLVDPLIVTLNKLDNTISNVKNKPIVNTYTFADYTFDLFDKF